MKTLGILGGVGPQTTSKVYLSIIDTIRKSNKNTYPPIIIYNLPFPFVIENEAIIQGKNSEKMIPYLIDGAKILEKAGADFGILPCNTLHKYIGNIRESTPVPFLSMLDEVALHLKLLKAKTVGVLATKSTICSNIYKDLLEESGINVLYPTDTEQDDIGNIIIELLNGKRKDSHRQQIEAICQSLANRGADTILLACTDLQLGMSYVQSPVPVVDTTEILIQASVRELTHHTV